MNLYCQDCGCLIDDGDEVFTDDGKMLCSDCYEFELAKQAASKEMRKKKEGAE